MVHVTLSSWRRNLTLGSELTAVKFLVCPGSVDSCVYFAALGRLTIPAQPRGGVLDR